MIESLGWWPRACALAIAASFLGACNVVAEGESGARGRQDADVQVVISPAEVIVHRNGRVPFVAAVEGEGEFDPGVVWSLAEGPAAGSIDEEGVYTAPDAHGTFTIVATAKANPRRRTTAVVQVGEMDITLAPTLIEAQQGDTIQFEAAVTGTWDESVTWSVEAGEITPEGLYSVPHREGTFEIVATSNADPSRSAKADVIVQELLITMEPWSATVDQGSATQLGAVLAGTVDSRVTWSAEVGSVDENGVYTAPFHAGTFPVRATSVSNPRKSAAASITVRGVSVHLDPWWAELDQGATLQFGVDLGGTVDGRVTWSADAGTVDEEGYFTAPLAPGDVHVTATSVGDPSASGTATVAVRQVGITLEPTLIPLGAGAGTTFVATVRGSVETGVIFSADGGTIDEAGFYTAPAEPGTYTITAAAVANPSRVATALVVVSAPPAALAWEDPDEGTYRLVENEVESTPERLVLDLIGPALPDDTALRLRLELGEGASWAEVDGSELQIDGRVVEVEAWAGADGAFPSLAIEPDGAAAPGRVRITATEAAIDAGVGVPAPVELGLGRLLRR